jgi:membrane protein YdbS with pleckstrin-like domain
MPRMDEPPELRGNSHWRMAVWSLRVGYVGLAVAAAGLIVTLAGGTAWILAAGVIIWLATVVVTLTGFLLARRELAEPRSTFWSMRFMLIHDSTHAASAADPPQI